MKQQTTVIFQTERLIIRPAIDSDWPFLLQCYNNAEVMKYIPNSFISYTKEQIQEKYQKLNNDENNYCGLWVIELKTEAAPIGEVGLFNSFNDSQKLEVGYILHEKYWKKQLGKELLNGLINYTKHLTDAQVLVARMFKANIGSIRLSEKCGMIKTNEGIAKSGIEFCQYELKV